MARRASSSSSMPMMIGIIVLVAAAALAAKYFLFQKTGTKLSGTTISMQDFLADGNGLRGNEYVVEGTIDQKLGWINDETQVVSLKVNDSSELLGIEVPATFNSVNIERNLKYSFKIKIREGGIPVATKIERL